MEWRERFYISARTTAEGILFYIYIYKQLDGHMERNPPCSCSECSTASYPVKFVATELRMVASVSLIIGPTQPHAAAYTSTSGTMLSRASPFACVGGNAGNAGRVRSVLSSIQ